ncbi:ABC transporter ATP-binding protein [Mycobacterium sp. ACS4331]|uniref:ABC transporter ATP-binding protein n=1 Tax=Mycobacterium sp. ACS4331 TaxID=1834121 RepID=UPI0008002D13|nr:ABC transporter ATP-binding protein [Mycobacterium sp. ACS4331]OBF22177.1 multidrug ABC transporter ATP-binding protein [Mycobacterium sp. ACS4331]
MGSPRGELSPPAGTAPAISTDRLTVIRGRRPALSDVCVDIAAGTVTGLLGPSGCGKTTLMRCIVGTQIIASGTVTVLGQPAGSSALRHRVGYVTQNPTVYSDLRVLDNVRYFAALYGRPAARAGEVIDAVGLRSHADERCANLSSGQRSRVSLACALVGDPELLILDEPTVGLDPVLRVELWQQFDALARRGTTLLISSHVMDEADHCADLLLMRQGRVLTQTTPTRLREETRCDSLEQAFLSVIRHSTAEGQNATD